MSLRFTGVNGSENPVRPDASCYRLDAFGSIFAKFIETNNKRASVRLGDDIKASWLRDTVMRCDGHRLNSTLVQLQLSCAPERERDFWRELFPV